MSRGYLEFAEQLEPHERRAVRHIAFWILFAYLEVWTFVGAGTDLVAFAAAGGLIAAIVRPLRPYGSFFALHVAIATSMVLMLRRDPSAILVVELVLLIVLVVAQLRRPSAAVGASLLLLHALAFPFDPWSGRATIVAFAHTTARALALLMMLSMIWHERVRAAARRLLDAAAPQVAASVPSVAQWERSTR